jgi:thiamine biosynthesis lipoprotein
VIIRILSFTKVALLIIALYACDKPMQQHNYSILAFGTLIDVTLYDVDRQRADTAFEQLQQAFDKYHHDWSPWTNGDLAKLNSELGNYHDGSKAIKVPDHLLPIIKRSISLSHKSENYFNPAIGKLINLWQFHKYQDETIQPPEAEKIINLTRQNPDMADLTFIDENRLTNNNPALMLNFGAFAKGYAIELAINKLKKLNINNAIINAGGDLSAIGQHGERAWNIGIRHPRNESILASIEVKGNESVFTSGDYERFYFYQSKRFHHILNPTTGYPANDAQSVTVLHEDAGLADAAATALFVAGSKNWQRIATRMRIRYVMLVDAAGNIHLTPAMEKRIKFHNKSPSSHIIVNQEL